MNASATRPQAVGPDTAMLVDVILRSRPHPEQGFRSCIGILAPGQALRRRARRCRLRPRAGARHPLLQLGRRHPEEPSRERAAADRRGADADPREHSRSRLLPLTQGESDADPSHGRAPARARPHRHGRRLHRDAERARCRRTEPRGLARAARRSRGDQPREQAPRPPSARGPAAPVRRRRGRRLPRPPRPRPRSLPQARHLRVGPRASSSWCVIGPTGIGKSWLACALGHKACREGFSVLYKRACAPVQRSQPRRAAKAGCRG